MPGLSSKLREGRGIDWKWIKHEGEGREWGRERRGKGEKGRRERRVKGEIGLIVREQKEREKGKESWKEETGKKREREWKNKSMKGEQTRS